MDALINPAKIDFVTLRLFCAVAQVGSMTRGAQACNLAVSAASRRLAEFERATGTKLFERSAQGVVLTSAGHVAHQHAIRLFQGFEHFGREIQEFSRGSRGHVRLWANMSSLTEFLPACLATFLNTYPDIHVELEEQLSGDIVKAVLDGVADIGIFAENTLTGNLNVEPFMRDELVAVCSHTHELGALDEVSFKECLEYEFVGLNRGASLLELTSRAADECGKTMRLRIQVRSFDAMCQMINSNLGIGILPRAVLKRTEPHPLRAITLTDPWAKRRLLLGTSNTSSTAASLLTEHLRNYAKQLSGAII